MSFVQFRFFLEITKFSILVLYLEFDSILAKRAQIQVRAISEFLKIANFYILLLYLEFAVILAKRAQIWIWGCLARI